MKIGNLEIEIFKSGASTVNLTKCYNSSVCKSINLNEDDIYALEFAVKEMKRKLGLE